MQPPMKHPRLLAAVALVASGLALLPACHRPSSGRPDLVVLIAVDQLRADLLERYDAAFTGGFRRLRDHGRRFTHGTVDHAITISHPGHVTLGTGMHPSHH